MGALALAGVGMAWALLALAAGEAGSAAAEPVVLAGFGAAVVGGGMSRQRRRRWRLGEPAPEAAVPPVWTARLEDLEQLLELNGPGAPAPAAAPPESRDAH